MNVTFIKATQSQEDQDAISLICENQTVYPNANVADLKDRYLNNDFVYLVKIDGTVKVIFLGLTGLTKKLTLLESLSILDDYTIFNSIEYKEAEEAFWRLLGVLALFVHSSAPLNKEILSARNNELGYGTTKIITPEGSEPVYVCSL